MMGQLANVAYGQRLGVGFTPVVAAAAPATGPLAPIVLAVAAVLPLFSKLLNFGYNPRKLADTAITEAVKQSLNILWYNLTGEAINGVHQQAEPGQYGEASIALFAGSNYPNVPYPAGAPGRDARAVIQEAQQIIAQGRANLVRQESYEGYDFNAQYMLGLMEQVAQRQAEASPLASFTSLFDTSFGEGVNWKALLALAGGGYALYEFVL